MDALATAYDSSSSSSSSALGGDASPRRGVQVAGRKKRRRVSASASPSPPPAEEEGQHKMKKKKRLRPPPASLLPAAHIDDPAQHQGRTRTRAHVEGDFAAHVYVRVPLLDDDNGGGGGGLGALVREVVRHVRDATADGGAVYVVGGAGGGDGDGDEDETKEEDASAASAAELHVSVSRVVYLRSHQREEMRRAVKRLADSVAPFTASFASFVALANDARTRAFLGFEVGAGHDSFRALAEGLAPALRAVHQEEFYAAPRFHASVVWTLMRPRSGRAGADDVVGKNKNKGMEDDDDDEDDDAQARASADGETPLDERVRGLQASLGAALLRAGTFYVDAVHVRIGRDVRAYALRGDGLCIV